MPGRWFQAVSAFRLRWLSKASFWADRASFCRQPSRPGREELMSGLEEVGEVEVSISAFFLRLFLSTFTLSYAFLPIVTPLAVLRRLSMRCLMQETLPCPALPCRALLFLDLTRHLDSRRKGSCGGGMLLSPIHPSTNPPLIHSSTSGLHPRGSKPKSVGRLPVLTQHCTVCMNSPAVQRLDGLYQSKVTGHGLRRHESALVPTLVLVEFPYLGTVLCAAPAPMVV